jgi:hypothetical protein
VEFHGNGRDNSRHPFEPRVLAEDVFESSKARLLPFSIGRFRVVWDNHLHNEPFCPTRGNRCACFQPSAVLYAAGRLSGCNIRRHARASRQGCGKIRSNENGVPPPRRRRKRNATRIERFAVMTCGNESSTVIQGRKMPHNRRRPHHREDQAAPALQPQLLGGSNRPRVAAGRLRSSDDGRSASGAADRGRRNREPVRVAVASPGDPTGQRALPPRLPTRHDAMKAANSVGAILMTFRIRTCGGRPTAQRVYTVAVVTDKRSATCLTDSRRSGASPHNAGRREPARLTERPGSLRAGPLLLRRT